MATSAKDDKTKDPYAGEPAGDKTADANPATPPAEEKGSPEQDAPPEPVTPVPTPDKPKRTETYPVQRADGSPVTVTRDIVTGKTTVHK